MPFLVLISDRPLSKVLPACEELDLDIKTEPLSVNSIEHVAALRPETVLVDAAENLPQAWTVLQGLRDRAPAVASIVVVERDHVERYPWHEVASEFVYPGTPPAELRVRLAMLRARTGSAGDSVLRLGALLIDSDSYLASVRRRRLDLTFKEFELLKFLASDPGRVFTRPQLLREVWGYDFYGGTRTVDVHVRRLRAKLGPEHEHLIQTVRGVGYRAAQEP
jgi:DNA-binding response OmpR family regulator